MINQLYLSEQLKFINFFLFNFIKNELWEDYFINIEDINFLLELDAVINLSVLKELWLWKYILKFFKENPEYLDKHDDPYELFIDSGYLDSNLNVK